MLRLLASDEIGYVRALERGRRRRSRDEDDDEDAAAAALDANDDDEELTLVGKYGALDRARACVRVRTVVRSNAGEASASRAVTCARRGGVVEFMDAASGTRARAGFAVTLKDGATLIDAYGWCDSIESEVTKAVTVDDGGNVRSHAWEASRGEGGTWTETGAFKAMENAVSSDYDAHLGSLVVGGRGRGCDVMIYDVAHGTRTFKAGYPPANWLGYTAPPWVSASCFAATSECKRFFVGTGEHRFRHYDTRASDTAVLDLDLGKGVITCVASSLDGREAYVANARGAFEIVDLRIGKTRGKFKGNSGSIRGIAVSDDGAHVACAGLDQYVRVYDAKSRKCVASAYAKQPLTSIVFDSYTPAMEAKKAKAAKKKSKKSSSRELDVDVGVEKKKKKSKKSLVDEDDASVERRKKKKKSSSSSSKKLGVVFD